MKISCYDSDGNVLKRLYQFDTGQTITIKGADISTQVVFHFCNPSSKTATIVNPEIVGTDLVVAVPDDLLLYDEQIIAYLCQYTSENGYRVMYEISIPVVSKPNPDEQVFTVIFKSDDTILQTVTGIPYRGYAEYTGETPVKQDVEDPENYEFMGWYPAPTNIMSDTVCEAQFRYDGIIISDSWDLISERSALGVAENYYSIGDVKQVRLSGTIGIKQVDTTFYATIIDFDHNSELEGTGISFGCFKDGVDENAKDLALCDSLYGLYNTSHGTCFSMNAYNLSHGGWKASDLRYGILGSTDVAPDEYMVEHTSGSTGYDATSTCATNPVPNTFISCLPEDLRSVMKPITKYTDNVGGGTNLASNVTPSVDYLPLMTSKEVLGTPYMFENAAEAQKQTRYLYYAGGNSALKYRDTDTTRIAEYWLRSPQYHVNFNYSAITTDGSNNATVTGANSFAVRGLSPVFMV